MYGSDTTSVSTLAATGTGIGVLGAAVSIGVLVFAGIALITIALVVKHRRCAGR